MSFSIIRMQKFKAPDIKGMQIHNQREKESHTNPDIKEDETSSNYDLLNDQLIDFNKSVQDRIDEGYTGTRAVRKDAVRLCEFVVTSDKAFFDGLSSEGERLYFEESLKFLQDRYGKENVLYSIVHKDEKTPHMHVGMVPLTEDGKLSAKTIFNKVEMGQLQTAFHKHVSDNGFILERGVPSDKKHIETQRLKVMTAKDELQETQSKVLKMEKHLIGLSNSIQKVKKLDKIEVKNKKGLFSGSERVEMSREDYLSIKRLAKASEGLREKNKQFQNLIVKDSMKITDLEIENEALVKKVKEFASKNTDLNDEVNQLKKENRFLRSTLDQVKDYCKDKIIAFNENLGSWKAIALIHAGLKPLKKYFNDDQEVSGAKSYLHARDAVKELRANGKAREFSMKSVREMDSNEKAQKGLSKKRSRDQEMER